MIVAAPTVRSALVLAAVAVFVPACSGSGGNAPSPTPSSVASTPTTVPAPTQTDSTTPTTSAAPVTTAASSSTRSSVALTRTTQTTLRPVTAAGAVKAGFTVRAGQGSLDCSAGTRSPAAVTDGVLFCAPSAAYALACFRAAAPSAAYCLADARARTLLRYQISGAFPAAHPAELQPRPFALTLADGTPCTLRDSGAGARLQQHPSWVQYYYCGNDESSSVWAPPDSTTAGITKGDGPWQVQVADSDGTGALSARTVATATFVGTAS